MIRKPASWYAVALLGATLSCSSNNGGAGEDDGGTAGIRPTSASSGGTNAAGSGAGTANAGSGTSGSGSVTLGTSGGSGPLSRTGTVTEASACAGLSLKPEPRTEEKVVTKETQTQVPAPVALYIVLDNSKSMDESGTSSKKTKWDEAVASLSSFVNDPASGGIDVAIQYFHPVGSGVNPDECSGVAHTTPAVALGRLPDHATNITKSLANTPRASSTPTVGSLIGGTEYCVAFREAHPDEQCVVVLVTDGQPNGCGLSNTCTGPISGASTCIDPKSKTVLAPIAASGLERGVRTFTIGMAGVSEEGFELLDALAVAGGSDCTPGTAGQEACDVSATGSQGFLDALNAIRDSITVTETITETVTTTELSTVPCAWTIPLPPTGQVLEPNLINVSLINGEKTLMQNVPSAEDCPRASAAAWFYDDPSNPTSITVCPSTCDLVTNNNKASVEVLFGCKTVTTLQ